MRSSIGPYRVVDRVGAGGMGTVYRVAHRRTGFVAAAKVLHGDLVGASGLERFRNEARIHRSLVHPCIALVHEYLEVDGAPCLVMEYVEGETLEARVRRKGSLPLDEAARMFASLVDAVGYVHQRGVIHRDLKTNNVKINERGDVKLLDFGIAMSEGTARLTSTGNVVGTLLALSPEQLRTGSAEPRSDIWALGIVFYEMLTGRPPFESAAPGMLTQRILKGKFVPPSQVVPGLPRSADRIVERCLRVRAEERYASCEALLTDVNALRVQEAGLPDQVRFVPADLLNHSGEIAQAIARQWRLAGAAMVALLALLFFTWAIWPSDPRVGPGAEGPAGPLSPSAESLQTEVARSDVADERIPSFNGPSDRVLPAVPDRRQLSNVRPVVIRVVQGEADVYRDGVHVGRTPFRLEAPIGSEIELLLRRKGCDDESVKLRVVEEMGEFMESLKGCRNP